MTFHPISSLHRNVNSKNGNKHQYGTTKQMTSQHTFRYYISVSLSLAFFNWHYFLCSFQHFLSRTYRSADRDITPWLHTFAGRHKGRRRRVLRVSRPGESPVAQTLLAAWRKYTYTENTRFTHTVCRILYICVGEKRNECYGCDATNTGLVFAMNIVCDGFW